MSQTTLAYFDEIFSSRIKKASFFTQIHEKYNLSISKFYLKINELSDLLTKLGM
jgi:hypothetical protein